VPKTTKHSGATNRDLPPPHTTHTLTDSDLAIDGDLHVAGDVHISGAIRQHPALSNEIDSAEVETTHGPFAGDAFAFTLHALSGTVVTIPPGSGTVYLRGHSTIIQSAANSLRGLAIAAVGSTTLTQAVGRSQEQGIGAGSAVSCEPFARIPAGQHGDYQLFAFGVTGNITPNGAASDPTGLYAQEVG
jgi:hypothetical protein